MELYTVSIWDFPVFKVDFPSVNSFKGKEIVAFQVESTHSEMHDVFPTALCMI